MALKIILPLLALVGQIASQDQDPYQLYRIQENLDELPLLPDEADDRSALSSLFPNWKRRPRVPPPPPRCSCPLGYSMCAKNPYDQNEVGCIVYCYRTYYPTLDLNKYRWVCPVYQNPFNPGYPQYGALNPGNVQYGPLNQGNPQYGPLNQGYPQYGAQGPLQPSPLGDAAPPAPIGLPLANGFLPGDAPPVPYK